MKYELPQKMWAVVVYPSSKTVVVCGHAGHHSMTPLRRCLRRMETWALASDDPKAFATTASGPVSGVR